MSRDSSTTRNLSADDLVAYLDGELDARDRATIEQALKKKPSYRARLAGLRRAWELLDELPHEEAGEAFATTTVSMVAVATREDSNMHALRPTRSTRKLFWLACLVVCLAMATFSFTATRIILARPLRKLMEHLPLIQRVDEYSEVRDLLFLQLLVDSELLFWPWDDAVDARGHELIDVHQLTPAAKRELGKKSQRFEQLSSDERAAMVNLHDQLSKDPRSEELERTMHAYHRWLDTIDTPERLRLAELAPYERVDRVRKLMENEIYDQWVTRVTPEDARRIQRWLMDYVVAHEKEIVRRLPETQRRRISEMPDTSFAKVAKSRRLMFLFHPLRTHKPSLPTPSLREFQQLKLQLSPESRKLVNRASDGDQRRALVERWIETATSKDQLFSAISEQELLRFYQQMPDARKEHLNLERLSPDELRSELGRIYFRSHHPGQLRDHARSTDRID